MQSSFLTVLLATGFTFLMTIAGSSIVFFFSKEIPDKLQQAFLGFASGVMMAASIWSLLIPSMEQANALGKCGTFITSAGFLLGAFTLLILQRLLSAKISYHKLFLLFLAITLHNIPEGMAVSLAWPLAFGIGIQNFPEGAAIALPLRKSGLSRAKSFLIGSATGIVEPLFGLMVFSLSNRVQTSMPWLLSFSAGAMIYVVVEELIPEAKEGIPSHLGTLGCIFGFLLMMIFDVTF